jgi:predicted O-methyltransferase YrrM
VNVDLSILCVTRAEPHAREQLARMWQLVRACASAELVIAADGDDAEARVTGWAGQWPGARVARVDGEGYLETVLDAALRHCTGSYVLRLDDDECCSAPMERWVREGGYRAQPHWKFSRAHLWPDRMHRIVDLPLWPDHQTRLSRRHMAGGRSCIHAGSPHGGGTLAPVVIEHLKFLVRSREEREEIARRYDRVMPGAGTSTHMRAFQLPDLASAVVEPNTGLDVPAAVDAASAVGMHQHRGEIEAFARWLALRQPHHVVEIGTLHGGTSHLWHALASGLVVSVDLPAGRFGGADHGLDEDRCERRNAEIAATCPRFRGVLGDSHQEATRAAVQALLGDSPVDLLFIDGDHTYEGVRADLEMYRGLVRPGGVIAFHDILDTDVHRQAGCQVDRLWAELPGPKAVFSVSGPWGGIGVTFA